MAKATTKTKTKTKAATKPKTKTKAATKPKPKAATKPKPKPKPKAATKPRVRPKAKAGRWLEQRELREGRAAVRITPRSWGFVDEHGTLVIAGPFSEVGDFHEGLASARKLGEATRYLRSDGSEAFAARFANGRDFQDGVAFVFSGGQWGAIDREGNVVLPCAYSEPERAGRWLIVSQHGKRGVADLQGRVRVPLAWDEITVGDERHAVRLGKHRGFVDHDGTLLGDLTASAPAAVDPAAHPFRFYGVRPGNWVEGANMGHSYRLQPRAPLTPAARADLEAALRRAFAKGPVAFGQLTWNDAFAHLRVGEQGKSTPDRFFTRMQEALLALHDRFPLTEVVYWNAQERSRDPWERWSRALQPDPAPPVFGLRGFLYSI